MKFNSVYGAFFNGLFSRSMQPASSAGKHKLTLASILLLIGYENGPRFDSQSQSKWVQINTMVREANFWVAPRLFLKTRVSPNSLIRKLFFYVRAIKLIFAWKLFAGLILKVRVLALGNGSHSVENHPI